MALKELRRAEEEKVHGNSPVKMVTPIDMLDRPRSGTETFEMYLPGGKLGSVLRIHEGRLLWYLTEEGRSEVIYQFNNPVVEYLLMLQATIIADNIEVPGFNGVE
jgi:hypothetical protein